MIKALSITAAVSLIVVGLIVLPMPIPTGAIMIVIGLVLLLSVSVTAIRLLRAFRRKHPNADGIIREVEARLPAAWRRILRRSDP